MLKRRFSNGRTEIGIVNEVVRDAVDVPGNANRIDEPEDEHHPERRVREQKEHPKEVGAGAASSAKTGTMSQRVNAKILESVWSRSVATSLMAMHGRPTLRKIRHFAHTKTGARWCAVGVSNPQPASLREALRAGFSPTNPDVASDMRAQTSLELSLAETRA